MLLLSKISCSVLFFFCVAHLTTSAIITHNKESVKVLLLNYKPYKTDKKRISDRTEETDLMTA